MAVRLAVTVVGTCGGHRSETALRSPSVFTTDATLYLILFLKRCRIKKDKRLYKVKGYYISSLGFNTANVKNENFSGDIDIEFILMYTL